MSFARSALRQAGVPFILGRALLAMYYGGGDGPREIVSPKPGGVRFDSQRELGLLENLQNLLLASATATFGHAAWRFRSRVCALAALPALLTLLEEVDYGAHWLGGGGVSLHNREGMLRPFQTAFRWGALAFFGLFPIVARRLRPWAPERGAALGMLVALGIDWIACRCRARGLAEGGTLRGNEGEFFELMVYALVLLYALDLHRRQGAPAPPADRAVP
ncbi:MAG: hypothetical protein ACT4PV_06970 [Planctomycetaceae bacterium]